MVGLGKDSKMLQDTHIEITVDPKQSPHDLLGILADDLGLRTGSIADHVLS